MRIAVTLWFLVALGSVAAAQPAKPAPGPAGQPPPTTSPPSAAAPGMPAPTWLADLCQARNARACLEEGIVLSEGRRDAEAAQRFWFACAAGDEPVGCDRLVKLFKAGRAGGFDLAKERARLAPLCDGKDARACLALGHLHALGLGGPVAHAPARVAYEKACALDAFTCGGQASQVEEGLGVKKDVRAAAALYRKACDAGNLARGCGAQASLVERGAGVRADRAEAARIRDRACQAGDGGACARLAGEAKGAAAIALRQRACSLGVVDSCAEAGRLLATSDPPAAGAAYAAACYAGRACGELARLIAGSSAKAALPVYELACQHREARACVEGGLLAGNGGGDLPADLARGRGLLEKGCELAERDGCGILGVALIQGLGGAADPVRGVSFVQRACDAGRVESCGDLGVAYAQGLGVKADPARAKALLDDACRRGHTQSCDAARQLAQRAAAATGATPAPPAGGSRGSLADDRAAAEAAAAACDAKPEKATCAEAARRYLKWTLPTVPLDEKKAVLYFEKACTAGDGPSCMQATFGPVGTRSDPTKRRQLWQRACDLGAGEGCARVADALPYGDAARAKLYLRACDLRHGGGCVMAGATTERADLRGAIALYRRGCDLDDINGCVMLADHLAAGTGVTRDVALARRLYDRACRYFGAKDSSCTKRDALK